MIVGLVGLIGSGKGTVGDILERDHDFIKESFAKPLKDAVSVIFNWDRQMLEGATPDSRAWREQIDPFWSKELGKEITPRLVLQWMGTEAGRQVFGDALWTSALIHRIDPTLNYVVTDVRFANEVDTIKNAGGAVIRVMRGDEPEWLSDAKRVKKYHPFDYSKNYLDEYITTAPHIHRSEWDWVNSSLDYTISNNGTLEDLQQQVNMMYTLMKSPIRFP